MNASMNRRSLLAAAGGLGVALALAGCATTTTGSVTTVTLNVAKITAYAQAGLNAIATVTDALAMFPALSTYTAPVKAIEAVLRVALTNFTAAAGSSVMVSYDDANIKTIVDSILADIQSIASQIATIIGKMAEQAALGISSNTVNTVQTAHDALATIISVFQALITANTAMRSVAPRQTAMSEAQALRALRA